MKFIQQHTFTTADDAMLIQEYKTTGKLEYLSALYQRYMTLVYGVCLKYLDEASSQDAVMQIFEELIGKVKQHEIQHFKSWLHVLSRNHCLMKLRAMKNRQGLEVPMIEGSFMEMGEAAHHDSEYQLEDHLQSMEKCLERLPAEQKKSVQLFYLQEKSYREVVELTGYEMNKVKSYIQNGKRNLKICMDQHG
ncbi:RNA polymerase sigma-70 factor, ECF subfamily [Chitinophaga costaii]|uniref:RNA polymerase sigma-70 factor, ECF subfamily n=1 Tax=Chitinophaga costaii TaxID=1335309 RepID=A0A1C4FS15_9BACT|nr:sigma-70 family RNA polymerase sigma factor [Chitinophaga costaii]PUZ20501.1 sigma-70 family RNA polymerase sigma factor [Chitinophaga costaii]SCC58666.1 RNA polymerase sigma-70 factor, ECF subfamily [Chitinophaga costaii]